MKQAIRSTDELTQSDFSSTAGTTLIDNQKHASAVGVVHWGMFARLTSATAVSEINFPDLVPAGSTIEWYSIYSVTGQTLATATHVSLGIAANPDLIVEIADATLDDDGEGQARILATALYQASDTQLQLAATNGSGADAGTLIGDYLVQVGGRRIIVPDATAS